MGSPKKLRKRARNRSAGNRVQHSPRKVSKSSTATVGDDAEGAAERVLATRRAAEGSGNEQKIRADSKLAADPNSVLTKQD